MTDWIASIEGTEAGRHVALILALVSAVAHATFGALQKWRYDPWVTRGAFDVFILLFALPVAIFVAPWPEPALWPVLAGAGVIHTVYKILQASAYSRGAYTVVYPVARGMAPATTVVFAWVVFGEVFTPGQWAGVALLSGAIMAFAALNLSLARKVLDGVDRGIPAALTLAAVTGVMIAAYTTYDAWGIRLARDPLSFLAWFFVIDGLAFPLVSFHRWRALSPRPPLAPLMRRGAVAALIAFVSFGSVMMATRLDKVGEAVALRETSVIFAAAIGWLFLKEKVGAARAALMALIALGAALVEIAS